MIALVTLEPTPFPPGVLRKENAYPLRNFYYNCLCSFSCSGVPVCARLSGQESEAGTICPIPLPGLRECRLSVIYWRPNHPTDGKGYSCSRLL